MADFSIATYTASGAPNVQYAVPFPFISRDHVLVLTAYDKATGDYALELVPGVGFTWISDTTIRIPALAAGTRFSIVRQTPKDQPLVDWVAGGGALTAEELRLSSLQALYVVQENYDRGLATAEEAHAAAADAAQAVLDAAAARGDAAAALVAANAAEDKADAAVSTANTASSNASTALSTANTAASNASDALDIANAANATANSADDTANAANDKADAAIAAIASSVSYTAVANVAAIPGSPANNTYIEVSDATGIESFTPLTGVPVGFVGDSGLRVRLRYTTAGNTWVWIDYSAKDADGRYVQETAISTSTSSASTTTVASSSAVKAAKDAADAAQGAANAAQTTADAALPKAGGTMTGAITFAGAQTFPAASTSSPGVVQLSTANNSTSTTQAATPSAVKSVQDFAQVVSNTANAAMPRTGGTFTGDIAVPSINNGPLAGMRNAIINGNFDIWQRGTSAAGAGFRADRWNVFLSAGTSLLQERYTLTDANRSIVGYDVRYALQVFTGDTTSSVSAMQPIEGVRTFDSTQVTASFWAWTSTGTCSISALLTQVFGTGGSPSASVVTNLSLSSSSVSTTPTRITATVTLPSIAGKTLGSDNNDYLGLLIKKVEGHTGALYITKAQLEAGPVATPFERRPIGVELALCQRYYQDGKYQRLQPITGFAAAGEVIIHFVPQMRATPTIVLTKVYSAGYDPEITNKITSRYFGVRATASVGSLPNGEFNGTWTASAEL